jgi:hypothetical protein
MSKGGQERSTPAARPLVERILRALALSGPVSEFFPPSLLIQHYRVLKGILDEKLAARILTETGSSALRAELLAGQLSSSNAALYLDTLQVDTPPELSSFIAAALKKVPADDWLTDIRERGELEALARKMRALEPTFQLGQALQDALRTISEQALAGKTTARVTPEVCHGLFVLLPSEHQEVLLRDLRDALIDSDSPTVTLTTLFKDVMSNCSIFVEEADRMVREGWRKILDRGNGPEVAWLDSLITRCPTIWENARPATKHDFSVRLSGKLSASNGEMQGLVTRLQERLPIGPVEPNSSGVQA